MWGPFHAAPQRAVALREFADPSGGRRGTALGRGEVGRVVVVDRNAGGHPERVGACARAGGIGQPKRPAAVASAELARRDQHHPLRRRAGGKIGVLNCGAVDRERAAPFDKLCGLEVRHVHRAEVCPNSRMWIRVKYFTPMRGHAGRRSESCEKKTQAERSACVVSQLRPWPLNESDLTAHLVLAHGWGGPLLRPPPMPKLFPHIDLAPACDLLFPIAPPLR